MPTATLPDGAIHHRDQGPADAPAIVFVHGVLVDSRLWDGVADRVVAAGFRAVLPDLPLGSHTQPMPASADVSPRGLARLLLGFLEHLDLDDVTLVANDSGGTLTQLALASGDERVGRVGRVVFTNCDTVDRFPPPPFDVLFRVGRLAGVAAALFHGSRVDALARLGYRPLVTRPIDAELARAWLRPGRVDVGVRNDLRRFLRALDPGELAAATERLGTFPGEVLVAWAPADRFFRIEDGRRLAGRFRHARVVEVPDSRTFVPLDQPARLADEVIAFCREAAPAA